MNALLHATVALISVAIVLAVTRSSLPGKRIRFDLALGVVLVALGLYFFPLGAIEAYDFTRISMGLSESMNAVLWYAISTALVVAGVLFLRARSHA